MSHILIIDDDVELCELLQEYLEAEGFTIDVVHDGKQGIERALAGSYDAIVLDIMLPGADGLTVLRSIREKSSTAILMLTAKGEEVDRIVGLELGADDYLPKPCNPRELMARLRAVLRRLQSTPDKNEPVLVGDLEVNPASRKAFLASEALSLTSTEYNLLEILIKNAGHVVSKETLSEQALGRELTRYDRSVDMHLSKLRHKLGPQGQEIIQTVRGMGYQLSNG